MIFIDREIFMNSEFDDFDQEMDDLDQQLESFEDDFEDFDEDVINIDGQIEHIEFTQVEVRTAVLSKDDMFALLCLKTADQGGAICRVDPREANPAVQLYDDAEKALDWYTKSLQTSKKNGWRVVYDGLPLNG